MWNFSATSGIEKTSFISVIYVPFFFKIMESCLWTQEVYTISDGLILLP